MKDLLVYHQGTGTIIALCDEVYLIDPDVLDIETLDELESGATVSPIEHKGWRLDNYNMTNLFFGE